MTTLITGARGALGRQFAALLPDALIPESSALDIRDGREVALYVADNEVDLVIHCAARTAVRYCEENREDAFATNVEGTRNLCAALKAVSGTARFVYISTACVFRGDDPSALYSESDIAHPKNYYALTKLLGEYVVSGWSGCEPFRRALVVRTNFSERGPWKHPLAFTDRFGTYLYPDQIARRVLELVEDGLTGFVHVCGDRKLSMHEFARLTDPKVGATTLADYDGPAVTVNMALTSERIASLALG